MSEKILEIKEISEDGGWSGMDGYLVKTDKQEIKVLISNGQSCCEDWGYLSTNDDVEEFVGADLMGITLTDTSLNTEKYNPKDCYDGGYVFVNFETNLGTMQLVVYNHHNGYYGHSIKVTSEQLNLEDSL